jgi:uncharacterized membrane protein
MTLEVAISWLLRVGIGLAALLILLGLILSDQLIILGLWTLLATPLLRLLVCFGAFLYRRHYLYLLLTSWIFFNLILTLILTS